MIKIRWTPDIGRVHVRKFPEVKVQWYNTVSQLAYGEFTVQHQRGKSGKKHRGLPNRSSVPGDYPAVQSGRLMAGTQRGANAAEGYIGTNIYYAKFLLGTRNMAPRKLYAEAMITASTREGGKGLEGYYRWTA